MNVDKQRLADAVSERLLKAKPGAKVSVTADEIAAFLEVEKAKLKELAPMCPALDTQEGGNHYKSMAIQPVEYNHANKIPYLDGNVIKYVSRHKEKNGIEDIKKAIHYCKLIAQLEYGVHL